MASKEDIKQLQDDIKKIKNDQLKFPSFKFYAKGYGTIAIGVALFAGYNLKEYTLLQRIKYGCCTGVAWPVIAFAMVAFTQ